MKRNYIVTYDIRDDKRLRKVFKTCKAYGNHLQYSVFECDLDPAERIEMEDALKKIIHHNEDQILYIDLGPAAFRGERTITALGQTYIRVDPPCFVV
jgi:CRISPR-associated protein Cas2